MQTYVGWTYRQSRKKHFNYPKLWYLYFWIWNFAYKICNAARIMLSFYRQFIFINFCFWVLN